MAISRAQLLKELLPGLNALFGLEYKRYGEEYKEIYETESSERSFEEETKLSGFGAAPVKNEGQAISYDNAQEAWTARYNHETIAMGFSITEEAMEDNLYETKAKFNAGALGRSMAATKETKAANVFNLGFSTTRVGGDGQPLFSASHPTAGGVNFSNIVTGNPDLSETALQTVLVQVQRLTDDRGILINAQAKSLHVAPENQFTAAKILETTLTTITATNSGGITNLNDINAVKSGKYFPQGYEVNTRFTDADAWFVKTDVPNGTIMFTRVPLKTAMEGDFNTGNMRYKARERYSFGWGDPRQWLGSAGS